MTAATASCLPEVRQLRAELDKVRADRARLAAMLAAHLAADTAEAQAALWRTCARESYQAGRDDMAAELAAAWPVYPPLVRTDAPVLAELELRRWGPGGRDHFGDRRPGDRTGAQILADAHASLAAAGGGGSAVLPREGAS